MRFLIAAIMALSLSACADMTAADWKLLGDSIAASGDTVARSYAPRATYCSGYSDPVSGYGSYTCR
jgi:hypothetical protein